jgi:chromosomal replication initiator protein
MNEEIWGRILEALQKKLGRDAFKNWVEPLRFAGFENGVVRLTAPTSFIGTWVARNYGDAIRSRLIAEGVKVSRLEFQTDSQKPPARKVPARQTDKQAPGAPARSNGRNGDDLPGSPLDKRCTFESFVVGKPNELAHAAARRVADGGDVTFNPLFLYGGVGLGKTHLMHAIAWELQTRSLELRVVYLSAEQFMYRFVQT